MLCGQVGTLGRAPLMGWPMLLLWCVCVSVPGMDLGAGQQGMPPALHCYWAAAFASQEFGSSLVQAGGGWALPRALSSQQALAWESVGGCGRGKESCGGDLLLSPV